jgi:Ca2+-transporting ATPase
MSFAVLSLSQLVHSFNLKSEKSLFKIDIFSNMKLIYSFILGVILQVAVISVPSLAVIFKTANLNFVQWFIVALLSLSPLLIVEIEKFFSRPS